MIFNSVVYLSNYFPHESILKYLLLWEESTLNEMVLVPCFAHFSFLDFFISRKFFTCLIKITSLLKTIKVEALVFYPLSATKIIVHCVFKYSECETKHRLTMLSEQSLPHMSGFCPNPWWQFLPVLSVVHTFPSGVTLWVGSG